MNKVVAFLEEYAQWVALGIASLFFLYVVYAYILVGDQLKVKVGAEAVYPEAVDTKINEYVQNRLIPATETPAGNLDLHVKDFAREFALHMGPERFPKEALASAASVRPPIPGVEFRRSTPDSEKVVIKTLPEAPAPTIIAVSTGNSLVAQPPPLPEEGQDDLASQPPVIDPSQQDPATVLANALDKKWVMLEGKVDTKQLADDWKKSFYKDGKPLPVPPEALMTHFLQLEVVREEQTGPETWGNSVALKPLPLVRIHEFPKPGDRKAEEDYRQWAETHQIDIVEPPFYTVLKGDPWYIPSLGAPKDPSLVDDASQQPFDPANPNIPFDKMTLEQKRMVYLYKQEKKAEEQKAKAAERRSQTQSQENSRGSVGGDRGGRRIGGYAPLPIQLAAGPGSGDTGRTPPPGRTSGRPGVGRTDPGRGDSGRGRVMPNPDPRARTRGIPGRDPYNRADMYNRPDTYGRGNYGRGDYGRGGPTAAPQLNGDGQFQNQLLNGPFDPTRIPVEVSPALGAKANDNLSGIHVWAYDENVESGKTYRYKMRIKLKNPLYNTYGLAANEADAGKFALVSDWSDWKVVTAPKTTEYFFTAMRQQLGGKNMVTSVTASIFRHAKGAWTMQTFNVAPGDAIGGMKDGVDYSTGATLVDLRPDTRERDIRILVSDNVGNVTTLNYQEQLNNEYLKTLQDKVNQAIPPTGGTDPAATGNRALINEVGGLR
jgi:hypothetical protein